LLLPKDLPLGTATTEVGTQTGRGGAASLGTEAAIELLLKAASADPNVQLLPWLEREFTLHAMKVTKGNQVRAAKLLGITRATLRKRIERFGITKELMIS
jgi:two-component system nitrogen regulation response regulator GlnG